jgi:hypothetical protein
LGLCFPVCLRSLTVFLCSLPRLSIFPFSFISQAFLPRLMITHHDVTRQHQPSILRIRVTVRPSQGVT